VSMSFFSAILFPGYGTEQGSYAGAWRGVFIQKNGLAEAMVLAVLVFLFARAGMGRSLRWLGIAASLTLLYLSRSVTGMIICAGIMAILALYRLVGPRSAKAIPFTAAGLLIVGFMVVQNFTVAGALQLVGRSPDLTGRTDLWSAALLSISKRPLLGYGFSAFWQGMNGESGSVLDKIGWMAGYAHNGFLDLMLHLGLLGLVTFAVGYLVLWRRALGLHSREPGPVPIWLCMFLIVMLLYNFTEGSILTQNSIYWVLYTSTAVALFPASFRRFCAGPNR